MPRIEPLFPDVALKHEQQYGPSIAEEERGYFFVPVTPADAEIDLSFLDPCKPLHVDMTYALKDLKITVADGMKVTASDDTHSQFKVMVESDMGYDHYKARDMVYRSARESDNNNCEFNMDLPTTPEFEAIKEKVPYFSGMISDKLSGAMGKVACRHLAFSSVVARQEAKKNGTSWRETFNEAHQAENIKETYPDYVKAETDSYDMHFLSSELYTFKGGFEKMTSAFRALLQILKTDAQTSGKHEMEKDFIVQMVNADNPEIEGHSLHLALKVRQDDNQEGWTYKVKMYDPNDTYLHRSFATEDLNKVAKTDYQDWFDWVTPVYQKEYDTINLIAVKPNWKEQPHETIPAKHRVIHNLILNGRNPNPVQVVDKLPMHANLAKVVKEIIPPKE